jgi:predicted transcriptional regulator
MVSEQWFLKAMRQHFNLSQGELGKLLNTTQSVISELETGRRNPDNVDIKFLIKAFVGLAVEEHKRESS